MGNDGLRPDESQAVCASLDADGLLDYVSVCAGSSSSLSGAVHIAAPMTESAAYTAPLAAAVKSVVRVPVIVAGRINQPHEGDTVIAQGHADVCDDPRPHLRPRDAGESRTQRSRFDPRVHRLQ